MLHILKSQQFNKDFLADLFISANIMRERKTSDYLENKIIGLLFFEPSTRTFKSFEIAAKRLEAKVVSIKDPKTSSQAKGENLYDTIMTMGQYVDCLIIRHPEIGAVEEIATYSPVPIINAGDGAGQHPTQALLDLYTIERELGKIDNLKIAMVGDLANGRTVRSLSYLLAKYDNVKLVPARNINTITT